MQGLGSIIIVWNEERNMSWVFLKEISSGGDVNTVDIIYPASPLFLLLSPEPLHLMLLLPVLAYANNETCTYIRYNLPWAPHHTGKWPNHVNGQESMPMEESGNMLILIAAIAKFHNGNIPI